MYPPSSLLLPHKHKQKREGDSCMRMRQTENGMKREGRRGHTLCRVLQFFSCFFFFFGLDRFSMLVWFGVEFLHRLIPNKAHAHTYTHRHTNTHTLGNWLAKSSTEVEHPSCPFTDVNKHNSCLKKKKREQRNAERRKSGARRLASSSQKKRWCVNECFFFTLVSPLLLTSQRSSSVFYSFILVVVFDLSLWFFCWTDDDTPVCANRWCAKTRRHSYLKHTWKRKTELCIGKLETKRSGRVKGGMVGGLRSFPQLHTHQKREKKEDTLANRTKQTKRKEIVLRKKKRANNGGYGLL